MSKMYYLLSHKNENYHYLVYNTLVVVEENVFKECYIATSSEDIEDIINHLTPKMFGVTYTKRLEVEGISFKDKIDAGFFKDVLPALVLLHDAKIRKNRRLNA